MTQKSQQNTEDFQHKTESIPELLEQLAKELTEKGCTTLKKEEISLDEQLGKGGFGQVCLFSVCPFCVLYF
jgi:hypothetical protein